MNWLGLSSSHHQTSYLFLAASHLTSSTCLPSSPVTTSDHQNTRCISRAVAAVHACIGAVRKGTASGCSLPLPLPQPQPSTNQLWKQLAGSDESLASFRANSLSHIVTILCTHKFRTTLHQTAGVFLPSLGGREISSWRPQRGLRAQSS